MKILTILLLLYISITSIAQKVDVDEKDSLIKVDGVAYAKVVKEGNNFSENKTLTFYELDGTPAIVVKYFDISNVQSAMNPANLNGNVFYSDINFLKAKQKAQIEQFPFRISKAVTRIVKAHLFKDGKIDENAVGNFVLINPVQYTK